VSENPETFKIPENVTVPNPGEILSVMLSISYLLNIKPEQECQNLKTFASRTAFLKKELSCSVSSTRHTVQKNMCKKTN
jgi:hypothetical protein